MIHVPVSLRVVLAAALITGSGAHAQEISARPTLFFSASNLSNCDEYRAGLHLGLTGSTPEFGPGFTIEADVSALASEAGPLHSSADAPSQPDVGIAGGGPTSQFTQPNGDFLCSIATERVVDNSSFLKFAWRPRGWHEGEGLSLTLMPLHDARVYLGYEFPAVDEVAPTSSGVSPGARLELKRSDGYVFSAIKSAQTLNAAIHENELVFAELVGGGVDLFSRLRLELQAAHADLGTNATDEVLGKPLGLWAAAARATFHRGDEIGPPTDIRRYADDPAIWETVLRPARYTDTLSTTVFGEAIYLLHTGLPDPLIFGATTSQAAEIFALEGRAQWRSTRAYLRMQARSGTYFTPLVNVPVLAPGFEAQPELSATLDVDHHFSATRLTPGISFEFVRPAALRNESVPGSALTQTRAVAFRPDGEFLVEQDDSVHPICFGQVTLRWDWRWISLIADGLVRYDANELTFADPITGVAEASHPFAYTFYFFAQGRFE